MAKKCKCPPAGAPEWVLTYGDMMSLLLCFFILLAALSELKKEDEYRAVVREVQKAFGMVGGGGKLPTDMDPTTSLIQRLEQIQLQQRKAKSISHADDPGIDGKEVSVTRVREGMMYAVGGRITFEPGSADLTEEARAGLRKVAELLRGYRNVIEVRGHAGSMEVRAGSQFPDLWSLSYGRSRAVMDFLVSDELRVEADRIRLVANGDREPVRSRAFTWPEQEPNRRVEIFVTDSLVNDFVQPQSN